MMLSFKFHIDFVQIVLMTASRSAHKDISLMRHFIKNFNVIEGYDVGAKSY